MMARGLASPLQKHEPRAQSPAWTFTVQFSHKVSQHHAEFRNSVGNFDSNDRFATLVTDFVEVDGMNESWTEQDSDSV